MMTRVDWGSGSRRRVNPRWWAPVVRAVCPYAGRPATRPPALPPFAFFLPVPGLPLAGVRLASQSPLDPGRRPRFAPDSRSLGLRVEDRRRARRWQRLIFAAWSVV